MNQRTKLLLAISLFLHPDVLFTFCWTSKIHILSRTNKTWRNASAIHRSFNWNVPGKVTVSCDSLKSEQDSSENGRDEQVLDSADSKSDNLFFGGIFEFFQNLDDIIDDFFNKRMGNGEIFYGKRKYKPSGTVEGKYNGFGLTDKSRIQIMSEYNEYKIQEMEKKMQRKREMEEEASMDIE